MKTLIIEDEILVAKDLQKLLLTIDNQIQIIAHLQSLEQAVHWFSTNPEPDLAFVDIQLSDGVSFELFHQVEINCPIVFTTAYNEYAMRAFKVNCIDYLLKPIEKQDLKNALDKFSKLKQNTQSIELKAQFNQLIKDINSTEQIKKYKERFLVETKNMLVPLPVSEIAYLLKDEIIFIFTFDGKKFVCDYQAMDEVEELLNPVLFYRANRQHIIQINSVENIKTTHKGLTVKLKNPLNVQIDISREKAQDFKKWLSE